jgi:hypothetical protein
VGTSANKLSAEEHARLDRLMLVIADEARGHHYHDFSSSGPTRHGRGGFEQGKHLHPNVDPVEWSRAFLAAHPGTGDFVPGADTNTKGSAEEDTERLAYITALYAGAPPLFEDTPGYRYFTQIRRLPLPPEVLALLRWVPDFRGDEGVLLVPYTDHAGTLLALGFTYITQAGQKSPYSPARMIYRGPRDWNSRALVRLGKPGKKFVETEGLEKALPALSAGAEYVIVTGGLQRLGVVPLEPQAQEGVIARDDDPPGSEQDQALWRAVVRRLSQNLKVAVTARPSETFGKQSVPFKDFDDVYRVDSEFVSILLKGANLEHGRLGEDVADAIYEEASWLSAVPLGWVAKGIAPALGTTAGRFIDQVEKLIKARNARAAEVGDAGPDGLPGKPLTFPPLEPWPDPVDGAELLSEIAAALPNYIRMTKAECDAVALCALHGHCFDCFDIMVIVAITSPQKRSGKTRLARLAARMAPKRLFISGGSAAFIARAIELHHLNLFADEFDVVVKGDPEKAEAIRGVFNALFDREGAFIGKCVPTESGPDPRMFSIWGPAWLSGIKEVWDTIEDRAVCIRLKRKLPGDKVNRLRVKDGPEFDVFRRKAARWAADNEQALRDADPLCPNSLAEYSDRAADAWGVLFSIAQVADKKENGEWLKRAHATSLMLNGLQDETGAATEVVNDRDDELALFVDVHTILLAIDAYAPDAKALREPEIAVTALQEAKRLSDAGQKPIKPSKRTPAVSGVQLVNALGRPHLFPDRSWSDWDHNKPIKSHHIIKLFRHYRIEQGAVRLPDKAGFLWGFNRAALDDAFTRYVSSSGGGDPGEQKQPSHPHTHDDVVENVDKNAENQNPHTVGENASEIREKSNNSAAQPDVRDADSYTPLKTDDATLTPENLASEAQKPPQSNIVDLPIGAVPRRKKEAEP